MLWSRRQHLGNIRAILDSQSAPQEAAEGSETGERAVEAEAEGTKSWSALELARRSGQHSQATADVFREHQCRPDG